jgi:hypothetical protein
MPFEILDARCVGKPCIGTANLFGDSRISHTEAFDVNLINDQVGQWCLRRAVVVPIEPGVDDNAFRNPIHAVLGVHLQIVTRLHRKEI